VNPPRLVLGTGILLALFNKRDPEHTNVVNGLLSLETSNAHLIVPSCVVFETAKRLLFDVNADAMRAGTAMMLESLDVQDTTAHTIQEALLLTERMGKWGATLEDAVVIQTALMLKAHVWTFNYRDFAAIKTLQFWTP
jgi:predicted nucleic acid-binding protein